MDEEDKRRATDYFTSKSSIPHFYLTEECKIDRILNICRNLQVVSLRDFVISALGLALQEVPSANAVWFDNSVKQFSSIDILVIKEKKPLILIKNADKRGLLSISQQFENHEKVTSYYGTVSVNDMSEFEIQKVIDIVHPSHACTLTFGKGHKKVVVDENNNNKLKVETVINITLSCDNRVIEEETAGKLLNKIVWLLNAPETMLNIK